MGCIFSNWHLKAAELEKIVAIKPKKSFAIDVRTYLGRVTRADASSQNSALPLGVAINPRYFFSRSASLGFDLAIDISDTARSSQQIYIGPNIQYRWFDLERFHPFIGATLPVRLRSQSLATQDFSLKSDIGVSAYLGIAWDFSHRETAMWSIFYRWGISYYTGLGSAKRQLNADTFNLGVGYHF